MSDVNPKHLSDLLTYSVQHAKGKQNHLVEDICDIVGRYSSSLTERDATFLSDYINSFINEESEKSKKHWLELIRVL